MVLGIDSTGDRVSLAKTRESENLGTEVTLGRKDFFVDLNASG